MYIRRLDITGFGEYSDKAEFQFTGAPGLEVIQDNTSHDLFNALQSVIGLKSVKPGKNENLINDGYNFAEINLEIDNTKGILALDYHTLNIKRRYFRNLKNEYFLNYFPCRLKDIRSLFEESFNVEGVLLWSVIKRNSFFKLSDVSLRNLWENSCGLVLTRNVMMKYEVKKNKIESNLNGIHNLIMELSSQKREINIINNNSLADRINLLEGMKLELERSLKDINKTLLSHKQKIITEFSDNFSKLKTTFENEIKQWTDFKLYLELSTPDNIEKSGIFINGFPKNATHAERTSLGWAFWSACMKTLIPTIAVLQVSNKSELEDERIIDVLDHLTQTTQLIVFHG